MSTTKNLTIDQGSVFYANLQYVDNSKNPISLSGYTLASQIRKSYYSANAASFTTTVIDAANGQLQLSFTSTQTGLIKPGRYVYDVEITGTTETVRIFEGEVTVTPGVTGNTYGTIFVSTDAIRGLTGNTGPQGPQGNVGPQGYSSNSLVNGNSIVSLNTAGILTLPEHGKIIFNTNNPEQYIEGTMGFHIYASDSISIDAGSNTWGFANNGTLSLPGGGYIGGDVYGDPGSPWFVPPAAGLGGLASADGQQYIQISNNQSIYIGTSFGVSNYEWEFRRNGTIKFPNNSTQSGGALPLANLKAIVASSNSWEEFRANIAAL
jgi:hypothetical protein